MIVSTVILLVLYCGASVAALGFGGVDLITSDAAIDDVLSVLGPLATGDLFGRVITLAIGMSALAALFTVAVSTPRTWLSMATYRALPAAVGRVHPVHRTPHVATFWWAGLSIATIVVLTLVSERLRRARHPRDRSAGGGLLRSHGDRGDRLLRARPATRAPKTLDGGRDPARDSGRCS